MKAYQGLLWHTICSSRPITASVKVYQEPIIIYDILLKTYYGICQSISRSVMAYDMLFKTYYGIYQGISRAIMASVKVYQEL